MTVSEILEEVIDDICKKYCKYPDMYDESDAEFETMMNQHCDNCPLLRL